MVERSWWSRATRPAVAPRGVLLLALLLAPAALSGCGIAPQSRVDECHRLSQSLRAENDRLRDTAVSLRSQNRDLNQRAVDVAGRLQLQEEELRRLSQSVSSYQEDRDQLAAAYERLKGQIRVSSPGHTVDATSPSLSPSPSPSPAAPGRGRGPSSDLDRRLEDLARAHPGWEFDPARGVLLIPAAQLFAAGTDRLRDEARPRLGAAAALWRTPGARDVDLLVVGRNATSSVRPAGLSPPDPGPAPARALGAARAARVRDLFARSAGIDPARIEVAGFEVPHDQGDDAASDRDRRIEIHLRPRGPSTTGAKASAAPGKPARP